MPHTHTIRWVILLVAGVLSALGFEPFDLWPVTLGAYALLADYTMSAHGVRSAFFGGWLFGIGQFGWSLDWIATAFTYQDKMPRWFGVAGVLLLSLYLALYPAIACALARWPGRDDRLRFVLYFAAAWMLTEYLRATVLSGFPWNPLGVIWLPWPFVARGASWVGAYGLSAAAVLAAGAVWALFRGEWKTTLIIVSFTVPVPLLVWTADELSAGEPRGIAIPVRVIQPNISQDEKENPKAQSRNAKTYASLSGPPGRTPRVLLWPEAAANGYLQLDDPERTALEKLLGPKDVLLIGGDSVALDASGDLIYYNSVFGMDGHGSLLWRYDKAHLVPFGEYLPWRSVLSRLGLSRLVAGEGDFSAGPGPRTFPLADFGSVGVQICYEIVFSGHVIDRAQRPDFLFNPSNDAWFGPSGPPQHLAQTRLRAIEEGLPIIRATTNGISAVIDAKGRLLATVPRHEAGIIDMRLPRGLEPTVFARVGLLASALFGATLCGGALLIRRGRKSKPATKEAPAPGCFRA
ncbi:MAG: apolipoprotein N-acyltransferase [Proteobacteria bacterium]|nr:apolipoprotein N-acyltransferase [Pseudomonadota bacterium]